MQSSGINNTEPKFAEIAPGYPYSEFSILSAVTLQNFTLGLRLFIENGFSTVALLLTVILITCFKEYQ